MKICQTNSDSINSKGYNDVTELYRENWDGEEYIPENIKKLLPYFEKLDIDSEKKDEPVLYTFYILKVDQNSKENYLKEVNKTS